MICWFKVVSGLGRIIESLRIVNSFFVAVLDAAWEVKLSADNTMHVITIFRFTGQI